MSKIFSKFKKKQSLFFSAAAVVLLIMVCIPLFMVAKYNYMSADDFRYGTVTHQAIQSGQPWKVFGLAAGQALDKYWTWQGSYSAIFLFALQPGIWGEKYYQAGTYIIIFGLILLQYILIRRICGKGKQKNRIHCMVGICALLCTVQILFVPYPEECFFWFNGGLYYTFFYAMQLLLFSEIIVLLRSPAQWKRRQWIFFAWMLFLAFVIGGGNLATGLSTALVLCLLTILLFARKEEHRFYILAVTIVYLLAFTVNIIAPGNAIRGQEPGYHRMSPVATVLLAIWHSMINVYSWTDYKMWLILLIAAPLLWQITGEVMKNWKFTFRFPLPASVLMFGIYASQLAPITYMDGSFGPKRMGDMMWFSYVLWLFCTEGYWLGWVRYRFSEGKIIGRIRSLLSGCYGFLQIGCLTLWCVLALMTNVRDSGTYKAWAAVRNGSAAAYAAENEERLKILLDPEIKDVYFRGLENEVEPIFIYDISPDNQHHCNTDMAGYYNKDSVNRVP